MSYKCANCRTVTFNWNRGRCPKCQRPHIDTRTAETSSPAYTSPTVIEDTSLADMVVLAVVIKSDESYSGGGGLFGGCVASSSWSDSSSSSSDYSSSSSDSGSSSSSD